MAIIYPKAIFFVQNVEVNKIDVKMRYERMKKVGSVIDVMLISGGGG